MPRYDYHCQACDATFEVLQTFDSEPVAACPACGSKARRLISHPAIHFKGSGFYSTDNRSSGAANGASRAPSDDREPSEKADAASGSESKGASASDTTSSSSS